MVRSTRAFAFKHLSGGAALSASLHQGGDHRGARCPALIRADSPPKRPFKPSASQWAAQQAAGQGQQQAHQHDPPAPQPCHLLGQVELDGRHQRATRLTTPHPRSRPLPS